MPYSPGRRADVRPRGYDPEAAWSPRGVPVTVGPYIVEPWVGQTECECPEGLCCHDEGLRPFYEWAIVDTRTDDYVGGGHHELKRDALAEARSLCAAEGLAT